MHEVNKWFGTSEDLSSTRFFLEYYGKFVMARNLEASYIQNLSSSIRCTFNNFYFKGLYLLALYTSMQKNSVLHPPSTVYSAVTEAKISSYIKLKDVVSKHSSIAVFIRVGTATNHVMTVSHEPQI